MKKEIKFASIAAVAFVLGLTVNNFAMSDIANYKIAVVDVQKVVTNSEQVKNLKTEQQNKIKEIRTFVENAKKSVTGETDAEKKKSLEEKYNKELRQKTANIEKEYSKKLQEIDKNISGTIEKEAKAQNYNIVLAKGIVLYGGDDITSTIMKKVK